MASLKEFTGSIIHSFLGPNKSNKLIVKDEEVCISRCPLQLFQKVSIQDPLSSLVEETLFAHHNLHNCSTTSLLAMWHLWNEEFMLALEDGCEIVDIVMNAHNVLENAVSSLSKIYVSLDSLLVTKNPKNCNVQFKNNLKLSSQVPVAIRFSSRHFSPSLQNTFNSEDESENFDVNKPEMDERCLLIVHGLDHDEDVEISNLVSECWKKQRSFNNSIRFQTDGLLVCPISLPSSNSTVIDGFILKSNLNQQCVKNGESNRALIINGSITFEYTHLGFSPKVSIAIQKSSNKLLISEKEIWQQQCCELILQLKINVLLVKDDIDPEIVQFCLNHSVLLLAHQPWSTLKILCHSLRYSPCTYILDCDQTSILKNISVCEWKSQSTALEHQYFVLNVNTTSKQSLQSILLCHPSPAVLEMKTHQLGHLASRLSSACQSGKLLQGGGRVEEYCYKYLLKFKLQNTTGPKVRVITAVANGFLNYLKIVSMKKELSELSADVYDLPSKVSAWHSAMLLACLTLQCDMSIVNGLENSGYEMRL